MQQFFLITFSGSPFFYLIHNCTSKHTTLHPIFHNLLRINYREKKTERGSVSLQFQTKETGHAVTMKDPKQQMPQCITV